MRSRNLKDSVKHQKHKIATPSKSMDNNPIKIKSIKFKMPPDYKHS